MIPQMINLSPAKLSNRRGADNFQYPSGTIIVDHRGYFNFSLFATHIYDWIHFFNRIKSSTVYQTVEERRLPEGQDEHTLKDELIYLAGKAGIDMIVFRRVAIYKEDENKVIVVITNNLEWTAATIAELHNRRWQIETFFIH